MPRAGKDWLVKFPRDFVLHAEVRPLTDGIEDAYVHMRVYHPESDTNLGRLLVHTDRLRQATMAKPEVPDAST